MASKFIFKHWFSYLISMYGLDHDHDHFQQDMFGQSKEENDTSYVFVLVIASGHIHYSFVLLAYGPLHESNHYKNSSLLLFFNYHSLLQRKDMFKINNLLLGYLTWERLHFFCVMIYLITCYTWINDAFSILKFIVLENILSNLFM